MQTNSRTKVDLSKLGEKTNNESSTDFNKSDTQLYTELAIVFFRTSPRK